MTTPAKVRIFVTEPWDFERITGTTELTGWTSDHADPDNEEWEVHLDSGFEYHGLQVDRLLAGPRYVGEHLLRMFDAVTAFPVRLAHPQDDDWHYVFIGMISPRPEREEMEDGNSI